MRGRTIEGRKCLPAMTFGVALVATGAFAQDSPQRVVITGSSIARIDAETPSPVQVITSEDLKNSGRTSVQEVLQALTANGQGTLSQSFPAAFASGASGLALRGLNVGATLVLIDGHRMAPYPLGDDGQRSFVDIANLPFDAIERIEILKDGASAAYGSDAIAGVVNIILRRRFVGSTMTADLGTSQKGGGTTRRLAGMFGLGDLGADGRNVYVSGEYRKEDAIRFTDRGGLFTQTDFTSTGGENVTPGAHNPSVGSHPLSGTGYVTDPTGAIVGFMPGCDPAKFAADQCTYHDTWHQIQPRTENLDLVGRYSQALAQDWQFSLQGTFFRSQADQVRNPQRTFTGGYQGVTSGPGVIPTVLPALPPTTIPSTNPSFPSGTGLARGNLYDTFLNLGPTIDRTDSRTTRAVAELAGHAGDWDVTASLGYSQVVLDVVGLNYIDAGHLQTALDSSTDPYLVGSANSPAVDSFISPRQSTRDTSKLAFAHLGATRDVMVLAGGPLSLAVGADYMHRAQHALAAADAANGLVANANNAYALGTQDVSSIDGELVAPVLKSLELDVSIRYDHYNLSGGKASPKAGFKFYPAQGLAVRGTFAKGFRAPGPSENGTAGQTFIAGTTSDPVLCPDGNASTVGNFPSQCNVSIAGIQGTNRHLKAETSKSWTLGLIVEPAADLSAHLDFYAIRIDGQIVTGGNFVTVRGSNLSPIDQVQPDGSTALVVPPVAPIAFTEISYINANSTRTSGVELGLRLRQRMGALGELRSDFMVTTMTRYDMNIGGVTYHLAGTHGPFAFSGDTGNPRTRIQWTNTLEHGALQLTGTLHYISSFSVTDPSAVAFTGAPQDTCLEALTNSGGVAGPAYASTLANGQVPAALKCRVGALTTFDLAGRYDATKQLSVHAAILNLFNAGAPQDWATYGGSGAPYNPALHMAGAVGRFFTLGATYAF